MMKYLWCTIQTSLYDESIKFYRDVMGLSVNSENEIGSRKLVFLSDGSVEVELIYSSDYVPKDAIDGISIGFAVDDIDEALAHMEKHGVKVVEGPFSPTENVTFFYVRDPNGVKVQLFHAKRP